MSNSQNPNDPKNSNSPDGPQKPLPPVAPQNPRRHYATFATFLVLGLLMLYALTGGITSGQQVKWSEFLAYADAKRLKPDSVQVEDSRITAQLEPGADSPKDAIARTIIVKSRPLLLDHYVKQLEERKLNYEVVEESIWKTLLLQLVPVIIIIALIWFLISRSMRGVGGGPGGMLGNFGKSRATLQSKERTQMTFADVAGVDEAKEEVSEIVEFLKNPKRFARLGGRIPRGVLLPGPPGCGKTLLAKAIAGEANVPFFTISGSDFVEMFVGVGASRVRDLFKQAKEKSPCIIFLDEIDAVGRRRGGGYSGGGGHDEREQTLNAILVEMDGFEANDQVIVIASTNRADVLDPALTRPGRFDRQVAVNLPDLVGRRQILAVHVKKVKLSPDVELERLARGTPMFSGAELAALINEATIIATLADKDSVEMSDLEEARDKVRFGRAQRSRRIEQQERVATAYHEAGHAVLQTLLPEADPLHKVTIIPRGQALGVTFSLPEKDRYGYGRKWLVSTMRVLCGGRIAEEMKTGEVSSGASMDIQMATRYAKAMILQWGMSPRLGFVDYSGGDQREQLVSEKDYSPETARVIDEEIRALIDHAYLDATTMVREHWEQITAVAEALLRFETLQKDEVERLMRGELLSKPTVSDMLSAAEATRVAKPATSTLGDVPPTLGGSLPSPA